jgi:RNA binding exosome subunit
LIEIDQKFFGDVMVLKYKTMLIDAKDPEGAQKWGNKIIVWSGGLKDNATLQEFTETILNDSAIENRDYSLARQCAEQLDYQINTASSKALLAEVYSRQGNLAKAAEVQYEAWMKADPSEKTDYKRVLDGYKKAAAKAGAVKPAEKATDAPAAE